jgi:hypothetical protein
LPELGLDELGGMSVKRLRSNLPNLGLYRSSKVIFAV